MTHFGQITAQTHTFTYIARTACGLEVENTYRGIDNAIRLARSHVSVTCVSCLVMLATQRTNAGITLRGKRVAAVHRRLAARGITVP